MSQNRRKKSTGTGTSNDEVEEMLREAEDAMLLKLNLNSHMAHVKPTDLHPDLHSRFQALKSGSANVRKPGKVDKNETALDTDKFKEEDNEDDLFARFAALKASIPKPSSSSTGSNQGQGDGCGQVDKFTVDGSFLNEGKVDEHCDDHEVEVQKIIMWAMDAARLDPSPSSDDEEEEEDHGSNSCNESDDDDKPKTNAKATR
ncbi:hypothetical protein Dimus_019436 [Dionaea muscipula]